MTVGKLEKLLAKIKHKRMPVFVDRDTLWTGNGTFNICSVESVEAECLEVSDGDGFLEYNKDGTSRTKTMLILKGEK